MSVNSWPPGMLFRMLTKPLVSRLRLDEPAWDAYTFSMYLRSPVFVVFARLRMEVRRRAASDCTRVSSSSSLLSSSRAQRSCVRVACVTARLAPTPRESLDMVCGASGLGSSTQCLGPQGRNRQQLTLLPGLSTQSARVARDKLQTAHDAHRSQQAVRNGARRRSRSPN